MATLVSDDFESGASGATATQATAGSSATVDGTAAITGSFGLHITTVNTGSFTDEAHHRWLYSAPASNIVEAEARIAIVVEGSSGDGVPAVGLNLINLAIGAYIVRIQFVGSSFGGPLWSMAVRGKDTTYVGTTFTMPSGTSARLWRVVYDASGANPVATLYIGGTQVATYTDTTSGSLVLPDIVQLGVQELLWTAGAWELYCDDLVVRDAITPGTRKIILTRP
jgi:hypothetical protein